MFFFFFALIIICNGTATSIKFGIITFVENRGIITIQVETEWAALHRLEVGMQMDLTGWD